LKLSEGYAVKQRIEINSHVLARPLSKTGEADILSAQDRFDMLDLIYTVGWCIDAQDYGTLQTVVTEDFMMDHAFGVIKGRSQVIDYFKSNANIFDGHRQQNMNMLLRGVDLSSSLIVSHLLVTRMCDAQGNTGGFPAIVCQGVCTDDLRKEKDLWKLQKRTVDQMSVSEIFMPDAAKRNFFGLTAKGRKEFQAR
jgi:hypothetical protein